MLTEVPSLKYFASALNGWASQQDKQIATRQMVLLFFFLTFSDFCCLLVYYRLQLLPVTSSLCGGASVHSLNIVERHASLNYAFICT